MALGSLSSKTVDVVLADTQTLVGRLHLGAEAPEGRVVAQQVGVRLQRDEVVYGDDLDAAPVTPSVTGLGFELENRPQEIPADPSEAVDSDANAQVDHLSGSRSVERVKGLLRTLCLSRDSSAKRLSRPVAATARRPKAPGRAREIPPRPHRATTRETSSGNPTERQGGLVREDGVDGDPVGPQGGDEPGDVEPGGLGLLLAQVGDIARAGPAPR